MPEERLPQQPAELNLDTQPFVLAQEAMEKLYALSLVNQTFYLYQQYRQTNHDPRWTTADSLYLMYMPPKFWPGCKVHRSSLPVALVFDQIEAALPAIMQALFPGDSWFSLSPENGATPEDARAQEAHFKYALDHSKDEYGQNFKQELWDAVKSILTYGTGGIFLEWNPVKKMPVPTWVDIRDMYFDIGAQTPSVDSCRSVIRLSYKTIDELEEWRNAPGMDLPSKEVLLGLAKTRGYNAGDFTRQQQAALLGTNYVPGSTDVIPNPSDKVVEVRAYYSKSRIIYVLGGYHVAYIAKNPYGFIPGLFAPCYKVLGRFYGLSIADVQESNQRYSEALLNGRLDELALALHPPRVQKASALMTPNQQVWRPGMLSKAADPKNDVQVLTPSAGATTNVFAELEIISRQAEQRTGINPLMSGNPRPANANRTLGGMQLQAQGSASRLYTIVKHVEDYILIPMLYKMSRMIQVHTAGEGEVLPGVMDGEPVGIESEVFTRPVRFTVHGAETMMTKEKLAQVFPYILQYLAQGPLIQGLSESGMTINWPELFQMLQDATGVDKLYNLVRPLSEEEKQAKNQPPPQVVAEQQAAEKELQTRLKMGEMKNQTEIQKAMIAKQETPMDQQAAMMKMEMERMKMEMKLAMEQAKLDLQREKGKMELQLGQMKAQLQAQELAMKASLGREEAVSNMEIKRRGALQDLEMQAAKQELAAKAPAIPQKELPGDERPKKR